MKVYRVEHRESQIGPYQGNAVDDSTLDYYWSSKHPGPKEDGIPDPQRTEHFGFKSVRQLLDWFLLWDIWAWKKQGFAVYKYDISDEYVRLGGRQLVFVRAQASSRREVRWLPFG